jgi:hypothetical protein
MSLYSGLDPTDKTVLDVLSVGTVVATMTNFLPAFAAILTIIWTGIRIYETNTVQSLLGKKRNEKTDSN